MDQTAFDILQSSKHKLKFPPRESVQQIKSTLGTVKSGAAITKISDACLTSAESVLDDFAEAVLKNRTALNLDSEDKLLEIFQEAFTNVTGQAKSYVLGEIGAAHYQNLAQEYFANKTPFILEHLRRKVRLKLFDFGGTMSSIQITGSQIGNVVLGSVNQSDLSATVANVIKQGGSARLE